MADTVYTGGIRYLIDHGWATSDVRVLLLSTTANYIVDPDHATLTDLMLGTNELVTTNYTRLSIGSEAAITDDTADMVHLDGDDITWTRLGPNFAGPTIGAAVVYFFVTDDTDSVPFLYLDTGLPKVVNGEDFTLQWDITGLVDVFQAP